MSDVKRYGSISRLTPEKADYYKKLHAAPWKQINDMIKECNIRNYSIYCHGEYLFLIMSILEIIMRRTWPRWQRIPRHSGGGESACRV